MLQPRGQQLALAGAVLGVVSCCAGGPFLDFLHLGCRREALPSPSCELPCELYEQRRGLTSVSEPSLCLLSVNAGISRAVVLKRDVTSWHQHPALQLCRRGRAS